MRLTQAHILAMARKLAEQRGIEFPADGIYAVGSGAAGVHRDAKDLAAAVNAVGQSRK